MAELSTREFDVLLMDLNYARDTTSGREGLELLPRVLELDGTLPVVVMTAYGSVEVAVEAMRRGARDFIEKPWDNERLLAILRTQTELGRALRKGRRLEAENLLLRTEGQPKLVAESQAMQPVLRLIANVGSSDANVLITGENGTGKSVIAQALHAGSPRASKPLVTINAPGLSEGVFESELFGHVKGAFTDAKADRVGRFEMADGGTLFLDEIAHLPLNLQSKLLRVLESGEFEPVGSSKTRRVDVRVLAATNADIQQSVANGNFRQDLLYRLNTVELRLPPLRDRREDIPLLGLHFLRMHTQRYRKRITHFDSAASQVMLDYAWPGNIRELDHVVEAGGVNDGGRGDPGGGPGVASAGGESAAAGGYDARRGGGGAYQEGPGAFRGERQGGGPRVGSESERGFTADWRSMGWCGVTENASKSNAQQSRHAHPPAPAAESEHYSQRIASAVQHGSGRGYGRCRRLSHEQRVWLLALLAGSPGVLVALILLWTGDFTPKVQWTLGLLIVLAWWGFAAAVRGRVVYPLRTVSNMLAALREEDFSLRAREARPGDAWVRFCSKSTNLVKRCGRSGWARSRPRPCCGR